MLCNMHTAFDIFFIKALMIFLIGIFINYLIYCICDYRIKRSTTPIEVKELYESKGVKETFMMTIYCPFFTILIIVIPLILSFFGVTFSDDDK